MSSIFTPQTRNAARSWRHVSWGNRRSETILTIVFCLLLLLGVLVGAATTGGLATTTVLDARHLPPSIQHPFGTDSLGRDMLARTLQGLRTSLLVGVFAAMFSAVIGCVLGLVSALWGGVADLIVTWLVDVFFSLPHLVLLILLAFVVGGGVQGVVIAVALTHWPGLTRIIRAEVLQLKSADYVQVSRKFGHTPWWIARHHMLPHVAPQFLVGLILLFPHAILHEAALSFIGIGIPPHTPAIGVILAESMRHLSTGYWWLAVMPGAALLVLVKIFDILGNNVGGLIDPKTSHE